MAKPFVYSVLAALLVAVKFTTAFPSDIHFKMRKTEKLVMFGSEDPDPEYDIFPMSLSGMRHIRETNKTIKCKIDLGDEEFNLNFIPTEQYLATKDIPVWSAVSDEHAYKKINYKPLTPDMSGISEFTMYHDVFSGASLVLYKDRNEKIIIEGFITSRYAIRSLPKRLTGELLNEIDDVTEIPNMMGGAIASNKDAGFYAVIKKPWSVDLSLDSYESNEEEIEAQESIEHHSSTEPDGYETEDNYEGETSASTTVRVPLEHHSSTEPNEHETEDNYEGETSASTTVRVPLEHHSSTEPNEHETEDNQERETSASTTVGAPLEHHSSTEPNEHETEDNYERETSASTTVGAPLEHHSSTEPNGHESDDEPGNHERKKRHVEKTLYPEILIILDHNALRHRNTPQALRLTLAFWNAVDLIYRTFNDPKIRLNIAGIIIAADNTATPYIAKDTSVSAIGDLHTVSSKMGKYFYKERVRFPINKYDIIVAMTTMNLCEDDRDSCSESARGYVNGQPICSSEHDVKRMKTLTNTMIIHNDGIFGPDHSFFIVDKSNNERCRQGDNEDEQCSDEPHPVFLSASQQTDCLLNGPRSIKPVDEVLPGNWLSMDGQCRNEGYAASCTYKRKIGICVTKGCRNKFSITCDRSEEVPLPGTKCGTAKYCNRERKCVHKV